LLGNLCSQFASFLARTLSTVFSIPGKKESTEANAGVRSWATKGAASRASFQRWKMSLLGESKTFLRAGSGRAKQTAQYMAAPR
jgi:hypothetical protein